MLRRLLFFFVSFIFLSSSSWSQNFTLEAEQALDVSKDSVVISVFISSDIAQELGTSDFIFSIDTASIDIANARIDATGSVFHANASYDALSYGAVPSFRYLRLGVRQKFPLVAPGNNIPVNPTRALVGRVVVPIKDKCRIDSLDWNITPAGAIRNWTTALPPGQLNKVTPDEFLLRDTINAIVVVTPATDTICDGADVDIAFNINGESPFRVVFGNGTDNYAVNSLGNLDPAAAYTPTITGLAIYQIDSVYDRNGCFEVAPASFTNDSTFIDQIVTASNAGLDDSTCAQPKTYTLAGNTAAIGNGFWTSNPAVGPIFVDNTAENTSVTVDTGGYYYFTWTISSPIAGALGACPSSEDSVRIRFFRLPSIATAPALDTCVGGLPFTLAELPGSAADTGIGTWSILSSPGGSPSFGDINDSASSFTVTVQGTYSLQWEITNGNCPASTSLPMAYSVALPPTIPVISNPSQVPPLALEQCAEIVNLSANNVAPSTGTWQIPTGGTAVLGPNAPNTTATLPTYTVDSTFTFFWVSSNGTVPGVCPDIQDEVLVTRFAQPDVSATITGPAAPICGTSGLNYIVSGNVVGSTYSWSFPSGFTIVSSNGDSTNIIVDLSDPSFSGNIILTETTSPGGCIGEVDTFAVAPTGCTFTASFIVLPNDTVCVGDLITLISNSAGVLLPTTTFQWDSIFVAGGNINVAPTLADDTISITFDDAGVKDIILTIVDPTLPATDDTTINIVVLSPPDATFVLNTPTIVCEGDTTEFQVNITGGAPPYTIDIDTGGGSIIVNNYVSGNPIKIVQTNGFVNYTLNSVSDNFSCAGGTIVGVPIGITLNALPQLSITGSSPATLCLGDSIQVTFTSVGSLPYANVYVSSPNGQETPFSLTGTPQTLFFTPSTAGILTYTIDSVEDVNTCVSTGAPNISGTATVTVNDGIDSAQFVGGDNICVGDNDTLTVTVFGGVGVTSYDYFIAGILPIINSSLNPRNVIVSPGTTTIYTLDSVRDNFNCVVTPGIPQTTTVNPLPIATLTRIAPLGNLCSGDAANFSLTFTAGTAPYTITIDTTGGSITLNVNADTTLSLVQFVAGTRSYSITSLSDANLCNATGPFTVIPITTNDAPTAATISGGDAICFGDNDTLSVSITGGNGPFNLTITNLGTVNPFTLGDPIVVSPAASTTYTLTDVVDVNGCSLTGLTSNTTTTVNPIPTAAISGTTTICDGASTNLTFNMTPAGGTFNVTYTDGNNVFFANGILNGATVSVSPSQDSSYTILSVLNTLTGCSDAAPSAGITGQADITVNPITAPTVSINQSPGNPFCSGDLVTFTVTASDTTATPSWEWFINDVSTGNLTNTFTSSTLNDADEVKIVLDVSAGGCAVPPVVADSVLVDVQLAVNPVVNLTQQPGSPVCNSDTLVFIADYTGAGASPQVRWFRNGILQVGFNDQDTIILTPALWNNNDSIRVRVNSSLTCPGGAFDESSLIINSSGSVTPFVEIIQSPTNPVCNGDLVNLTTNLSGQGANPSFVWKLNGVVQAGDTLSTYSFNPTGTNIVIVEMTSSAGCAVTPTDADTVQVNGVASVTPNISFTQSPAGAVCPGTDITFTSTYTGGGASPSVQWFVNNVLQAISDNFTLIGGLNGDIVRVDLVSSASCATTSTASSNTTIQVQNPVEPIANIDQNPGNPVCIGDQVTFNANVTGQGNNPQYEWFYNGSLVSSSTSYIRPAVVNGDQVRLILTNNDACSVKIKDTADIVINAVVAVPLTASVVQVPAGDSLCIGESVTFSVNITGGGANPSYNWSYFNQSAGAVISTDPTYTTNVFGPGPNFVFVSVNSSLSCASPQTIQPGVFFTGVVSGITPTVDIVQSPGNPICLGDPINFSVNSTGEGSAPSYEWFVNGASQLVNSTGLFTYNGATDGDVVVVELTSNICAGSNTARDTIILNEQPIINPTVSIDVFPDDTICGGSQFVSFAANPTGEGSNPSYEWKVGPTIVSTSSTYTGLVSGGDIVVLKLTKAQPCGGTSVTSDTVTIAAVASAAGVTIIPQQAATCNGDLATYEAKVVGMSISRTYKWQLNGVDIATTPTVTLAVSNGQTLTVDVQSPLSICSNLTSAFASLNISGLATLPQTPITSINMLPDNPICPGEDLILSSTDTFEGTNPSYKWYVNGVLEVVDAVFLTNQLVDGDTVILEMNSSASCANPGVAYDTLPIKYIQTAIDTADTTTFCYGDSVTLSLEDTFNVSIQWFSLSNGLLGTGSSITVFDTDSVYASISNGRCSEETDTVVVSVYRPYSKSITASGPTDLCFGENVTLNIPDSTGLTFQWLYGFDTIAGETDTTLLVNYSGSFNVIAQNNVCIDTIGSINVQVAPPIDSIVSIIIGDSVFCEGDSAVISVPSVAGNALGGRLGVSFVQTPFAGILGNNSRSLEAWVQTDTSGAILGYGNNAPGQGLLFRINNASETPGNGVNGALKVAIGSGYMTGTTVITDNNPHHVALVFQGDSLNDFELYVDGQLEVISSASTNIAVNTTAGTNLRIGTANLGFTPLVRFGGRIDEVRVWDFALDTASIRNNMVQPLLGTEPGLVGLWNFEDTTGGTVKDLAAGNDGTLQAGARIINEGGFYKPSPAVSYTWKEAISNTVVKGPGPDFFYTANSSGDYFVEINNGTCSQISDTITIKEIILNPVITNTSPIDLCFGDNVLLTSTNTTSSLDSIEWLYAGNGISVGTDSTFTANATGVYSVVYYEGACSDTSNAIVVNISPEIDTTMTIDGDTVLCDADVTILSVPLNGGNNMRSNAKLDVINNVANPADLSFINQTGRFTLQYWHKLSSPNTNNKINAALGNAFNADPGFFAGFQRGNVGGLNVLSRNQLKLHIDPDGANDFVFYTNGTTNLIADTLWHQVTISVDSNRARFYLDGNEITTVASMGTIDYSGAIPATGELTIGDANSYSGGFADLTTRGGVDEVRIWSYPLDSSTIANNWYRPLNGNEPGLVVLFDLDEDTSLNPGGIVNDLSANSYTGTLNPSGLASIVNYENSMHTDSLKYQWYNNGVLIAGATSNSLAVDTTGSYYVVISTANGLCSDTSRIVDINKYSIDAQISYLSNDTVCFGDSVQLTTSNLALPSTYDSVQWFYGNHPISTNFSSYNAGLSGVYKVVMYKNVCSDTSEFLRAIILPELETTLGIIGDSVLCEGDSTILTAPPYGSASFMSTANGDRIQGIGNFSDFNFAHQSGSFSVEYYAKISDLSATRIHAVVGNSLNVINPGFTAGILVSAGTGRLDLRLYNGLTQLRVLSNVGVLTDTDWHHYAFSIDSGKVKLFFDSVEIPVQSTTGSWTPVATNANKSLAIGGIDGLNNTSLFGSVDEVRIWNIPIVEEQIRTNFNRPINGDPSLVTVFGFNVDSGLVAGNTISDNDGNFTGTIVNVSGNPKTTLDNPFLPGDLTFEWFKDNISQISGPLNSFTVTDSGNYYVEVSNSFGCGPVNSRTITIKQNLISDTLFTNTTEFCYGTDSAKIWVNLNDYDSVEFYDAADVYLATLTLPTDTFYVDTTNAVYGIVYNTLDGKLCSQITQTVFITAYENPIVSFFNDSLLICLDDSDSLFSLSRPDSVYGGTGAGTYTYSWSPADSLGADSTNLFAIYTANAPGDLNFILVATDLNACFGIDSIRVITYPRVVPDLGPDTVNICYGDTLGLGDVLIVNGGKPGTTFSYQWNNNTQFLDPSADTTANPLMSGLVPGLFTYIITVIDNKTGCEGYDTISVYVNDSLSFNAFADTLICFTTPSIQLGALNGDSTAEGGTGSISYVWNPGTNLDNPTSSSPNFINPFIAGVYQYIITATDSLACTRDSDTIKIEVAPEIILNAGNDTILCFGDVSHQLGGAPTANGGFGSFGYIWSTISPAPAASTLLDDINLSNPTVLYTSALGLDSIVFVVTVFDTAALPKTTLCDLSDTVVIFFNPEIIASTGAVDFVCFDDTVSLDGSATGGSGNGFTYAWANDNQYLTDTTDNQTVFTGTGSGLFNLDLFAFDITNPQCFDTASFVFEVNDTLLANAGNDTLICYGQQVELGGLISGTSDTTISGGSGGFIYSWNGTQAFMNSFISSQIIKNPLFNLSGITGDSIYSYIIEGIDSKACTARDTITIQVNDEITVFAGVNDSICFTDTITLGGGVVATGGNGGFIYNWTSVNGNSLNTNTSQNPILTGDIIGIDFIKVIATDNRGCFDSSEIVMEINPLPSIAFTTPGSFYICRGEDTTLTAIGTPNNNPGNPLSYLWNNGVNTPINLVSPYDDSLYVVEVTNTVTGCMNMDSILLVVQPLPNNQIRLSPAALPTDTIKICTNITIFTLNTINDSSSFVSNIWKVLNPPGPTISNPNASGITLQTSQIGSSGNFIENFYTDQNGCKNRDTVFLTTNSLPDASFFVSDSVICYGDSIQMGVTGGPSPSTTQYVFIRNTPTFSNLSTGMDTLISFAPGIDFSPQVNVNTATIFSYTVQIQEVSCISEIDLDVIVNPRPLLQNVSNPIGDTVCYGQEVQLSLLNINPSPVPLDMFTWEHTAVDTSQVNVGIFSDSSFTVIVADTNGCLDTTSFALAVKQLPDVSLDTFGTVSICDGNSFDISAIAVNNYNYIWKDSATAGTIVQSGLNNIFSANTSGEFYVVIETDGVTCSDSSSAVTIIDNPLPVIVLDTIPDTASFCFGETVQLSELSAYPSYNWKDVVLGDLGNTSNTITIDTSVQIYLVVTDANACIDSSAVITFTEVPLSLDSINSGNYTPCAYSTETYTSTALGEWQLDASFGQIIGANLIGGFYVTTTPVNSVSINWNGAGAAVISFYPEVACPDTFFRNIVISPNPSAVITGPNSGCETDILAIGAVSAGVNYAWTLNAAAGFGTISNSNIQNITLTLIQPTVSPNGFDTTTLFLLETDPITGCDTTVGMLITKYKEALADIDQTGGVNTGVCVGETDVFFPQFPISGTSVTYTFSLGVGSTNTLNVLSPTNVEVTWNTAGIDTLILVATNGDCSDIKRLIFTIQASPTNVITSIVDGINQNPNPSGLCISTDSIHYQANPGLISAGDVVNWNVIGQVTPTPTSNVTNPFYALNLDTTGQYIITYTQTSTNGCTFIYDDTVSIFGQPSIDSIFGPRIVCEGANTNYNIVAGSNFNTATPVTLTFSPGVVSANRSGSVLSVSWGTPDPNAFVALEFVNGGVNGGCIGRDTLFARVDGIPNARVLPFGSGNVSIADTIFCQNKVTRFFASPFDSTYTYQWFLNGNILSGGDTNVIRVIESGSYTVSIQTLAVGCSDVSDTATTAEVLSTPEAIITGDTLICSDDTLVLSLVNSAFTIEWYYDTLNPSLIASNVTNIEAVVPGQYYAVLKNNGGSGNGCTDTSEVFNIRPLADAANLWSFDSINSFCNNDTIYLIGTNIGELLTFEWTTSGFGSINDPATDTTFYIPAISDSGFVNFEFSVSNLCIEDLKTDTITVRPSPDASYTPSALVAELNETVLFTVDNPNAIIYDWVYQQGSSSSGPSGLHTYTAEGNYLSYLIATNEFNCSDSFAVPIHVTRNQLIYIPNVFSPNATNPDNQVMRVYGTNISAQGFEIVMYNRWGIKVFETTELSTMKLNGWDGTLKSGSKLPSGVYTYYIKGVFFNGEAFQNVGTVTLIR